MDEPALHERIEQLVEDEHRLRTSLQRGEIDADAERARLRDLEQSLDQCWDLLRQRRARAAAGQDPDAAVVRPVGEVEGYRQ